MVQQLLRLTQPPALNYWALAPGQPHFQGLKCSFQDLFLGRKYVLGFPISGLNDQGVTWYRFQGFVCGAWAALDVARIKKSLSGHFGLNQRLGRAQAVASRMKGHSVV